MIDKNAEHRQGMTDTAGSSDPSDGAKYAESFRKGTMLLHQGRAAEAVPYLENAFSLQPDDIDVGINLSGAYIMSKKFSKAVAILESLSRQDPDHAKVWINLGAAYLGNPILARDLEQDKAISAFERALQIDPVAPSVAYNIGLIYRDKGETAKAIRWFKQAVKNNPSDRDARSLLRRLEAE